jgi:hypothetical protein
MCHVKIRDALLTTIAGVTVCFLFLLLAPCSVSCAPSDSMQAGSIKLSNGTTMFFRLYVPKSYTGTKKYPIVVTLHGMGEKGSDNRVQVDRESVVRQWMLDSVQQKYSPFILSPQCPAGTMAWSSSAGDGTAGIPDSGVVKILDSLKLVYSLDTTRFYCTGLSLGGGGTWAMAKSFPQKFAAIVPCAGSLGITSTVEQISPFVSTVVRTPYWSFHGENDATVPFVCDLRIDTAVRNAGYSVVHYISSKNMTNPTLISTDSLKRAIAGGALRLFSQVTNGIHADGWMEAWYNPLLVPWIFSKSKVNGKIVFTWPAPGIGVTPVMKRQMPPLLSGKLQVAGGIIRWSGIYKLPASLDIYSSKGSLVSRYYIGEPNGKLVCSGLAKGVYCIRINASDWNEIYYLVHYSSMFFSLKKQSVP